MFWEMTINVNIRGIFQPKIFISEVTSFTDDSLSKIIPTRPGSPFGRVSASRAFGSSTAKVFFTYCFIFSSNSITIVWLKPLSGRAINFPVTVSISITNGLAPMMTIKITVLIPQRVRPSASIPLLSEKRRTKPITRTKLAMIHAKKISTGIIGLMMTSRSDLKSHSCPVFIIFWIWTLKLGAIGFGVVVGVGEAVGFAG